MLATSYRADAFVPVLGDGEKFGVRISYVREEEPLGTGGALRNAADVLSDDPEAPIVALNGDVLSGHDLSAQLADFDRPRDGRVADVSLHLVEVPDARAFGCVPTESDGRVTAFVEKSDDPVTNQVNAGCYVFRRRVLDQIPAGQVVSVERETFPGLIDPAPCCSVMSRTPTGATSAPPRLSSRPRATSCSGLRPTTPAGSEPRGARGFDGQGRGRGRRRLARRGRRGRSSPERWCRGAS